MPINFTPAGDFSAVVDTLEPITLLRRGSANQTSIGAAWRYADRTAESTPSGGFVTASDVTWQFEWTGATPPKVGDRLLDAAGECFTLLGVDRLGGETRYKCESRNLRVAHGLDCRVAIEQAVWEDLGGGPEITGWATILPAVHARIQPERVEVDESTDPVSSVATYRITLEDSPPLTGSLLLDHNHRIVAGDGAVYRVLEFENAERIDALSVAVVRRED